MNAWNHTDFPLARVDRSTFGGPPKPPVFEARAIDPPWQAVAHLRDVFPGCVVSGWELEARDSCDALVELEDGRNAWRVMDVTIALKPACPRRILFVMSVDETSTPPTLEATLYDAVGAELSPLATRHVVPPFRSPIAAPVAHGWRVGSPVHPYVHGFADPLLITSWGPVGTELRAAMMLFGWNYTGLGLEEAEEFWDLPIRDWPFPVMILSVRTLPREATPR